MSGASDDGVLNQGPSPLFTPDQMRRLRLQLSRTPFYCEQDYGLHVVVTNSVANQSLQVVTRFEDLEGNRKPTFNNFSLLSNRVAQGFDIKLGEGLLFAVYVRCASVAADFGTCHVTVVLETNVGGVVTQLTTLMDGYCTTLQFLSWPYTPQPLPFPGGYYRVIGGTQPAAGAECHEVCPSGARWDLISVFCSITFAAGGMNRNPGFHIVNSGLPAFYASPAATIPPTSTTTLLVYSQQPQFASLTPYANVTYSFVPIINPAPLYGGDFWETDTDQLNAGDQWAAPRYVVVEALRLQ